MGGEKVGRSALLALKMEVMSQGCRLPVGPSEGKETFCSPLESAGGCSLGTQLHPQHCGNTFCVCGILLLQQQKKTNTLSLETLVEFKVYVLRA